MSIQSLTQCPICNFVLEEDPSRLPQDCAGRDAIYLICPFCGEFALSRRAFSVVRNSLKPGSKESLKISHALRRAQAQESWPMFDKKQIENIMEHGTLPKLQEIIDNLILWMGETFENKGAYYQIEYCDVGALIGVESEDALFMILNGLEDEGLIRGQQNVIQLTLNGWRRVEELKEGVTHGNTAFIAMKFGNPELDKIVNDVFRAVVRETGFQLQRLDDFPKAGPIPDRMKAEIRSARFMLVDVSDGNNGAYWEAGYADAIGKPVIYTCKKEVFEDRAHANHPHFDIRHYAMVIWDLSDPKNTAKQLRDIIQGTIPEAKQQEDEQ